MERSQFENILDFAIEREWESVRFYHRLLQEAPSLAMMEAIRGVELVERQHINTLEQFRKAGFKSQAIPSVDNIQLGEYYVTAVENQNYCNMLMTAIQREELSHKLYKALAETSRDPEVADLFEKLASEETQHKSYFESLYDSEVLKEN